VAAVRIVDIFELTVPLDGAVANAVVNFSSHTVSLVTLITDAVRAGRPVVGLAFNSIGRFGQSGILRERMIPRVLAAFVGPAQSGCVANLQGWRGLQGWRATPAFFKTRTHPCRWSVRQTVGRLLALGACASGA